MAGVLATIGGANGAASMLVPYLDMIRDEQGVGGELSDVIIASKALPSGTAAFSKESYLGSKNVPAKVKRNASVG